MPKSSVILNYIEFKKALTKGGVGDVGESGAQGLIGIRGEHGYPGPKGETGPEGARGKVGSQGDRGLEGSTGGRGIAGTLGKRGEMGPMPKHESRGDAIRFEIEMGLWGNWINLSSGDPRTGTGGGLSDERVREIILEESAVVAQYNTLIDTVNDIKYVGESLPGAATSAALWRINRIDLTDSGGDIEVLWADGVSTFTKIWDDRATFTYTPTG